MLCVQNNANAFRKKVPFPLRLTMSDDAACLTVYSLLVSRYRSESISVRLHSKNPPRVRERAATVKPRRRAHCSLTIYIIIYSKYLPTTIPLKNICIISLYTIVIKYYILFVRTYMMKTSVRRQRHQHWQLQR